MLFIGPPAHSVLQKLVRGYTFIVLNGYDVSIGSIIEGEKHCRCTHRTR